MWVWGKFYEYVLNSIFSGTWKSEKTGYTALNYWLGMDSGVISVNLSDRLPTGLRTLAGYLQMGLATRMVDPFARRITAQDGTVKNDGTHSFTPDELLHGLALRQCAGRAPGRGGYSPHLSGYGQGAGHLPGQREEGRHMKILFLSDEECPALWDYYVPGRLADYQLIISCGDLKASYLSFLVTMARCPVLYVHGNHDTRYGSNHPRAATASTAAWWNTTVCGSWVWGLPQIPSG